MIKIDELSDTQRRVLREIAREPNPINVPMGGNGRGPILSACRALVRKGVLRTNLSSQYTIVEQYREMANEELERWRKLKNDVIV